MRSFLTISFSTIAYLECSKSTLAFPNPVAGQACETLICPDIWDTLGGMLGNFLFQPTPQDTLDTPVIQQPQPTPDLDLHRPEPPPSEQPGIEIFTTAPTPDWQQCSAFSINPDDQKDTSNSDLRPCDEASAQIVWSVDCADTGQNKVTGSILSGMDALFFTSSDPLCPKKGGVSFWLARLTPQQITTLREDTQSVRTVVPNVPFEYVDNRKSFGSGMAPATGETNSFKKRDLRVIKQDPADVSLSFLSTTLDGPIARTYSYFSQGGRGTRAYVVCGGMDLTVDDLSDTEIDWIFAGQVKHDQSDIHPGGMGTCMGSKIAGSVFGVAKFATLVAVKYDLSVGGFIDALDKIVEDLMRWSISGYVVRGKAVVSINGGYPDARPGDPTADRIRELINELVKAYQVVVVVSAGFDPKYDYAEISDWPAALSPLYDIITVGAVDPRPGKFFGQRMKWSKGGLSLTTSAPGEGACSIPLTVPEHDMVFTGTCLPVAIVAGLVAYFFSIPVLSAHFLKNPNLPGALKDFVVGMSENRSPAEASVWNGLEADSMATNWKNLIR